MRTHTSFAVRGPEGERVITIAHTIGEDPEAIVAAYLRDGEEITAFKGV